MNRRRRAFVEGRAGGRCEYCGLLQAAASSVRFHVDHVRPRQHGGPNTVENLCLACQHCNSFKGPNLTAYDPATGELVRLFDPRTQEWNEHFELSNARIVGLTPTGRATVELLQMNAADRIELRELLADDSH